MKFDKGVIFMLIGGLLQGLSIDIKIEAIQGALLAVGTLLVVLGYDYAFIMKRQVNDNEIKVELPKSQWD